LERLDYGLGMNPASKEILTEAPSEYPKNVYYDTCTFYGPVLSMTHICVGSEQMLFGTDYPFLDENCAHVEKMRLSEADKT
jgi:aminocarboxymuconate-semialdehyde decarboxylase